MSRYATFEDFNTWEAKARVMTVPQLNYAIKDCSKCVACFRNSDPIAEGFYLDQLCTYAKELATR